MSRQSTKKEMKAIRYLIHHRLKRHVEVQELSIHPDDDTICAFVEGRLPEPGSSQMVSHLIACDSCRRTTAHFCRVDSEPDAVNDSPFPEEDHDPGPLIPEGLASYVIPDSRGDAVIAYQNPPEVDPETTADDVDQSQSTTENPPSDTGFD